GLSRGGGGPTRGGACGRGGAGAPPRRPGGGGPAAPPPPLPGLIGCWGRHLVARLPPWTAHGRAAALARTPLNTRGGVWPKKPKAPGEIPQTAIDPAAGWSQSGGHGWGSGWTRPLAVS